ncbi:MAG: hypothetical protein WDZ83_03845 [Rhizobiaceae bacterium]
MARFTLALAATLAAMPAASADRLPLSHGIWASPAEACALVDDPQTAMQRHWEGVFIAIGRGTVKFYEATCAVLGAGEGSGGRWTASLQCTGEGEISEHAWEIVKHDPNSFSFADTDIRYELCR